MRYMFLIYTREGGESSQSEAEHSKDQHWAAIEEAQAKGIFHGAQPLKSTASATTVRMQGNKPLVVDGPFAETKEQLAGYYILDCRDLDDAIAWAAKIPTACGGSPGCIEIRPFDEMPAR